MPKCRPGDRERPGLEDTRTDCDVSIEEAEPPAAESRSVTTRDPRQIAAAVAKDYWPALLLAGLFIVAYWATLAGYWEQWNASESYYSHGILVPLIAAYMIWASRKRIAAVPCRPSMWGLVLVVPSVPVFVFAHWSGSGALSSITFLMITVGGVLLVAGIRLTRVVLFPLLYLAFMIPMPAAILDDATAKIQLKSTTVATHMLSLSGFPATQHGSEIHSLDLPEPLIVGIPCSGFKLLISLMTFTAFFVYMLSAPAWKKALLVLFAMPLSVFINALRITFIGYAGIGWEPLWTGTAEAMHTFHDWSGYLGLVICFVILFGFARLIRANTFGISSGGKPGAGAVDVGKRTGVGAASLVGVVLVGLMALVSFTLKPLALTTKGQLAREDVPVSFGEWSSHDPVIEERVVDALSAGDLLQRVYQNSENGRAIVLFLSAARSSDPFHNPLVCIVAGGSSIADQHVIMFKVDKPRPVEIRASALEITSDYGPGLVLHWYMTGPHTYPATPAMRNKMRALQVQDIYDILTNFGDRAAISRRMEERQFYWYRFSTDIVNDYETDLAELKQFAIEFISHKPDFGE